MERRSAASDLPERLEIRCLNIRREKRRQRKKRLRCSQSAADDYAYGTKPFLVDDKSLAGQSEDRNHGVH
jgi:hypothetical protein